MSFQLYPANLTPSFIYFLSTLLASALFIILIKNFLTAGHSPKKNNSLDADKEATRKSLGDQTKPKVPVVSSYMA